MDRMTKEAIRYLGYGRNAVDEQTLALIKDSFEGLRSAVSPKSICRIFDLQHQSEECFQIGNIRMKSRSLGRNLKQCEKLILFGATLGTGADRLITRASLTDMAKAVVLQACAGYGDFDIQYQKPLMQMLDCAKTIGLTMTDSFMMTPTKSVTAVIGMSRIKERCPIQGCEICEKKDCEYRRDTI